MMRALVNRPIDTSCMDICPRAWHCGSTTPSSRCAAIHANTTRSKKQRGARIGRSTSNGRFDAKTIIRIPTIALAMENPIVICRLRRPRIHLAPRKPAAAHRMTCKKKAYVIDDCGPEWCNPAKRNSGAAIAKDDAKASIPHQRRPEARAASAPPTAAPASAPSLVAEK